MTQTYQYEIVHEWAGGRWQLLWDKFYQFDVPPGSGFPVEACREPDTGLWHQLAPPYQIFQVWVYYVSEQQWYRTQVDSNWVGGPHTCFGP